MIITRKPLISYLTADKRLLSSVQNTMHPLLRIIALQKNQTKPTSPQQKKNKTQKNIKKTQTNLREMVSGKKHINTKHF